MRSIAAYMTLESVLRQNIMILALEPPPIHQLPLFYLQRQSKKKRKNLLIRFLAMRILANILVLAIIAGSIALIVWRTMASTLSLSGRVFENFIQK